VGNFVWLYSCGDGSLVFDVSFSWGEFLIGFVDVWNGEFVDDVVEVLLYVLFDVLDGECSCIVRELFIIGLVVVEVLR